MAGGWTRDGAVQDQIDDTVKDAVEAARARTGPRAERRVLRRLRRGDPRTPREALPGVRTCVACQTERDSEVRHSAINRRGSKDSQLR